MMVPVNRRTTMWSAWLALAAICVFKDAKAEGILWPSESQLANGAELVEALKAVFALDSIDPNTVRRSLGFKMHFDRKATWNDERGNSVKYQYVVERSFPHISACEYADCYEIGQGYLANNGIRIRLPINAEEVCVSHEQLNAAFGEQQKIEESTIRHFAPGQTVPRGLLPQAISYIYVAKTGVKLAITFDYFSCASGIGVLEDHLPNWVFPEEKVP